MAEILRQGSRGAVAGSTRRSMDIAR